jgi:desulfoferrodoxin (superoxide reductase-like protein)
MPTKALESDPDLEFEFYLAQKLSMTVGEMRHRMTHAEFILWSRFYARKAQAAELERLRS